MVGRKLGAGARGSVRNTLAMYLLKVMRVSFHNDTGQSKTHWTFITRGIHFLLKKKKMYRINFTSHLHNNRYDINFLLTVVALAVQIGEQYGTILGTYNRI